MALEAYLGDGAYVEMGTWREEVRVYTTDGITRQNEVVMEREAVERLIRFCHTLWDPDDSSAKWNPEGR